LVTYHDLTISLPQCLLQLYAKTLWNCDGVAIARNQQFVCSNGFHFSKVLRQNAPK